MPGSAGVLKGRSQRMHMVTTQRRTFPVYCLYCSFLTYICGWYTIDIHCLFIWVSSGYSFIIICRCSTMAVPILRREFTESPTKQMRNAMKKKTSRWHRAGWLTDYQWSQSRLFFSLVACSTLYSINRPSPSSFCYTIPGHHLCLSVIKTNGLNLGQYICLRKVTTLVIQR